MPNYTILLIDYDPRSIERTRNPLVLAGYTVHVATDGLSGVAAFSELQPDLVLIEAMIPKKHGFEVCQDLKKTPQGKRTPFVIMTSVYKGRKYRSQALHLYQCDEYVEKPIPDDQLLAIVRRFIGEAPAPAPGTQPMAPFPAVSAPQDEIDFDAVLSAEDDSEIEIEVVDVDAEAAEPEPEPPAPAPSPGGSRKVVMPADEAEIEIMERLDAIIPGASSSTSSSSHNASFGGAATAAARRLDEPFPGDFASTEADPIADDVPNSSEDLQSADHSQVVPFDRSKRSRKAKRGRRAKLASTASPAAMLEAENDRPEDPSSATVLSGPAGAATVSSSDHASTPLTGGLAEEAGSPMDWSRAMPPSLDDRTPPTAAPRWIWVVAAVGILLALYVLVLR